MWRYGGLVKITSSTKEPPSSLHGSESTEESSPHSGSPYSHQLLEVLHHSIVGVLEDPKAAGVLSSFFDEFGLRLLKDFLSESKGVEDVPLNAMVGKSCSICFS